MENPTEKKIPFEGRNFELLLGLNPERKWGLRGDLCTYELLDTDAGAMEREVKVIGKSYTIGRMIRRKLTESYSHKSYMKRT